MEVFAILFLVIILIIVIKIRGNLLEGMSEIKNELHRLSLKIESLKEMEHGGLKPEMAIKVPEPVQPKPVEPKPEPPVVPRTETEWVSGFRKIERGEMPAAAAIIGSETSGEQEKPAILSAPAISSAPPRVIAQE